MPHGWSSAASFATGDAANTSCHPAGGLRAMSEQISCTRWSCFSTSIHALAIRSRARDKLAEIQNCTQRGEARAGGCDTSDDCSSAPLRCSSPVEPDRGGGRSANDTVVIHVRSSPRSAAIASGGHADRRSRPGCESPCHSVATPDRMRGKRDRSSGATGMGCMRT